MIVNPPDLNHVLAGISLKDIASTPDMSILQAQEAMILDWNSQILYYLYFYLYVESVHLITTSTYFFSCPNLFGNIWRRQKTREQARGSGADDPGASGRGRGRGKGRGKGKGRGRQVQEDDQQAGTTEEQVKGRRKGKGKKRLAEVEVQDLEQQEGHQQEPPSGSSGPGKGRGKGKGKAKAKAKAEAKGKAKAKATAKAKVEPKPHVVGGALMSTCYIVQIHVYSCDVRFLIATPVQIGWNQYFASYARWSRETEDQRLPAKPELLQGPFNHTHTHYVLSVHVHFKMVQVTL